MKPAAALAVVAALVGAPLPASAKLVHFAHRHHGHHQGQGMDPGQPLSPPAAPPPTGGSPAPEGW